MHSSNNPSDQSPSDSIAPAHRHTLVVVFLVILVGFAMFFLMSTTNHSFCGRRPEVTVVTVLALALLALAWRMRSHAINPNHHRICTLTVFLLVTAVSAGIFFDILATRTCNEGPREDLIQSQPKQ